MGPEDATDILPNAEGDKPTSSKHNSCSHSVSHDYIRVCVSARLTVGGDAEEPKDRISNKHEQTAMHVEI